MCQNGLKILLRAIVRHGPKTGDLPSVWLDTCGSLPYQPDALARVAASPSQGLAGSKAWRGQRLGGVKPCSGLRKAGRRPRTGFAGPFKREEAGHKREEAGQQAGGSGTGPILLSQATFLLAHIANSGPVPLSVSPPGTTCIDLGRHGPIPHSPCVLASDAHG